MVRVSVNDVNDNFPEFAPSNYEATVPEGLLLHVPFELTISFRIFAEDIRKNVVYIKSPVSICFLLLSIYE